MKAKIHPNYFEDLKVTCACGNVIIAGSTRKELKTEICSACHPFYTGKQKLIDTAGRVDKFLARVKKAQKIKEKQIEIVDEELEGVLHSEPKVIPAEEPVQTTLLAEEPETAPAKEETKAKVPKAEARSEAKPVKAAAKPAVKAKAVKSEAKAPARAAKTPAKAAKTPAKKAAKKPAAKKAK